MVTEFLMVLSITNFGILCLFFYIISISVSSVELQDLYILEPIYRIKDMGQLLSSSLQRQPCLYGKAKFMRVSIYLYSFVSSYSVALTQGNVSTKEKKTNA